MKLFFFFVFNKSNFIYIYILKTIFNFMDRFIKNKYEYWLYYK